MVKRRVTRGTKKPRRFWNVDKILGEGPYAVGYAVVDSTGHLRKKHRPGDPPSSSMSIDRVKRFKTLMGAIGFWEKKQDGHSLPYIFLWGSRSAKIGPLDMGTGVYSSVPTRTYDECDLNRLSLRKCNTTYDDLIEDIRKVLGIYDRYNMRY
jgi:hypothetical protein